MLNSIFTWIEREYAWLFGGVGIVVLTCIWGLAKKIIGCNAHRICVISFPHGGNSTCPLTPKLKLKALNEHNIPMPFKKIKLDIYIDERLVSHTQISGPVIARTNIKGEATFENLTISCTGCAYIVISCDELKVHTDMFNILPPKLRVDFWNHKISDPEYIAKLRNAAQFNIFNIR